MKEDTVGIILVANEEKKKIHKHSFSWSPSDVTRMVQVQVQVQPPSINFYI